MTKSGLFLAVFLTILSGCSLAEPSEIESAESSVLSEKKEQIVIMVGEGGTSQNLFSLAAETFQREHGGTIFEVNNGDEFVAEIKNFVEENGAIDHMEYFGHGNQVGLFVNQEPGVHGGIYAYDPATLKEFLAASIYELPRSTFAAGATMQFNGCNVANGYPEKNSLAQSFANHFAVTVTAPLGPTEFSLDPEGHTVVTQMRELGPGTQASIYMLPTYDTAAFINVTPQVSLRLPDLHEGQSYSEAAVQLLDKGLDLNFSNTFLLYQNITGAEALAFCETAFSTAFGSGCELEGEPDQWIRNLDALKMLADAATASITVTNPVRDGYIRWAADNNLLTEDFTNRTWYTRAEMSELTWNIYLWKNPQP